MIKAPDFVQALLVIIRFSDLILEVFEEAAGENSSYGRTFFSSTHRNRSWS
ncbi:MAG: hypothetical protein GY806_11765 [Gammaproteobacteria bacterium]|nr:hypothetical protein [Gammaproteobacteria bacterium]